MNNIIEVNSLSKVYKLYDHPIDRMKESLSIRRKKYYQEHFALRELTFSVEKGDNIGIVGVNGAGKSTLLKIITGLLTPTVGKVKVEGKVSALLELGAGFNPEYTGLENIYLNGTLMGYDKAAMDRRLSEIINFADIGEFIHQPVKMYSSGMFARLAFAVAINIEPEILIVDEALSVGDTRFQIKCMNKMKKMIEGGTTVLFVSHDTNTIKRFCNKAIWLNKGELLEYGDAVSVCDSYLDFLKLGEIDKKEQNSSVSTVNEEIKPFVPGDNMAEIVDFKLINSDGIKVETLKFDDYVRVEITYDVYDEQIPNPVLGIAIRGLDDDYICGLNTLIDQKNIPWSYGRNRFVLEYPEGIRAIGGKYYFDAALFEETATVPIHFYSMIYNITISSEYKGEGRYVIPHLWKKSETR